ncbi:type I pullulanase [Bacillus sp. T33-2]|uniref:type I pullulanase n=1 Tax=Bacillus sp. T33-2 TaxID=2054168 RepID=UPI000C774AD7|nr:type I pullulanase [Bacillus sp. T33-2]PLR98189.1 type I pullulanase [Bacillus sp. T33-2]
MIAIERQFYAYLDEMQVITILLPYNYHQGSSSVFFLTGENLNAPVAIREKINLQDSVKYICDIGLNLEIGRQYHVFDEHGGKTDLQIGAVIRTPEFDQFFYYGGNDLGAAFSPEKTVFKLWAPTATNVKINLISPDSGESEHVPMTRLENGVWTIEVERNLEMYRYTYLVCINLEWREAVDPYARAVTVNGKYGAIIDLEHTKTEKPGLPPLEHHVDAVIYETHIRDFTIHPCSGVQHKGTYSGAAERCTVSRHGEPTCLSYVKKLGITHIEFLPFNDFEGVDELNRLQTYNWGYNPIHFNVPDGSYSSDPENPYTRIIELKKLIGAVHEAGMRVIMDAVYNHVYIRETSAFEKLVPGYYFRHDSHGLPSNGTGVGNDFASERLMARKFIIDSVIYWMKEYHVDGFRFDLMGIIDVITLQEIRKAVDQIDPAALIIGEGWDLNTPIPAGMKANIGNQEKLPRIGQFNDWFRDTIKGSTFNLYDKGYIFGNERFVDAAKQVLAASIGIGARKRGLFLEPGQSVNYVESHDNHTLWDKISVCDQEAGEQLNQKRHRLATSLVLLAQGIPFLHSGQEFFRTKKGIGNSYRSPDEINWLDWDLRDQHLETVEYIRGLISLRQSHQAFRLREAAQIKQHMIFLAAQTPVIGYCLSNVKEFGKWDTIAVFFNPTLSVQEIVLPENGMWNILVNDRLASATPIGELRGETAMMDPCSVFVGVI